MEIGQELLKSWTSLWNLLGYMKNPVLETEAYQISFASAD